MFRADFTRVDSLAWYNCCDTLLPLSLTYVACYGRFSPNLVSFNMFNRLAMSYLLPCRLFSYNEFLYIFTVLLGG